MRDFQMPGRSAVFASNALCATSHPLGAQTAVDIMRRGGNAMDAAIAGAVILGLCEPQMTGLGGDCFVLWSRAGSDEIHALNGSGRAAAAADPEALRAQGMAGHIPQTSAHAVTIPGAVDAFCHLAGTEGKLGLDAVLAPAIRYAEEGIPVAPRVASDWARAHETLQGAAREWFLLDGKPPQPGQIFRAPGQAEVFRRIARDGRDAFYTGEVAEDMLAALNSRGGIHTASDFAATACTPTTPVSGTYKGIELVEHPPNGQGATAILMLNILSHFDLAAMEPFGLARTHLEAEASKLAYDARNRFIADPETADLTARMLDPETARRLAALIDPARALPAGQPLAEDVHRETIYITTVDPDGMQVSLIYSIFKNFGSGIASDKFGILLHHRGSGFNLTPGHPNEYGPGKRPMHTIIPAMLRQNGRVHMPFGVMGGQYQACGHARVITNILDYGMHPQAAIDAPRSFVENGVLSLERGYPASLRGELAAMGHDVREAPEPIGGAQAIRIHDSGVLEGASDPRKDGCALGF